MISTKDAEPITLHDIVLYDEAGQPWRKYKTVTLAGEALKDANCSYIRRTQDEWISHYAERKESLPSLPLVYAIIEKLCEEKNPAGALILTELHRYSMCTSTRNNYESNTIIHDYGRLPIKIDCPVPKKGGWAKDVTKEKWRTTLQALLMCRDVDKAVNIIEGFSKVHFYLGSASNTESSPVRAAFVNILTNKFDMSCGYILDMAGISRSVTLE